MIFSNVINIAGKTVKQNAPTFIIAEAGVNHNGNIELAKKMIDLASEAGADAVKFQAFRTEALILDNVQKAAYQRKTTSQAENQYNMLKNLELSKEKNMELKKYCQKRNIIFLTTPFDEISLDELDELELDAYKIASTDITNLPFLRKVAKKQKPIILSTGMSYMEEVELAIETIFPYNRNVILLQCTANYPIEDSEANLNVLDTFKEKFDILLGYSDHTVGVGAAPYAIAKGAVVLEKHFTLNKTADGPDQKASLSPDELKAFVKEVRRAEKFMGSCIKMPTNSERKNRLSLQKCFVARCNIKKGENFSDDNIIAKRTGGIGISPIYEQEVLSSVASRDYAENDIIEI